MTYTGSYKEELFGTSPFDPIYYIFYSKNKQRKTVLFKSLRNCKRRNKGKFTLKSNSNKIMLCDGGDNDFFF